MRETRPKKEKKKRKFDRDVMEYKNNRVYDWRSNNQQRRRYFPGTPKSILKNRYSQDKRVAFESSEYESSDPNTETSEGKYDETEPSTSRDVMPSTNVRHMVASEDKKSCYTGTATGKVYTVSTTKKRARSQKRQPLPCKNIYHP